MLSDFEKLQYCRGLVHLHEIFVHMQGVFAPHKTAFDVTENVKFLTCFLHTSTRKPFLQKRLAGRRLNHSLKVNGV